MRAKCGIHYVNCRRIEAMETRNTIMKMHATVTLIARAGRSFGVSGCSNGLRLVGRARCLAPRSRMGKFADVGGGQVFSQSTVSPVNLVRAGVVAFEAAAGISQSRVSASLGDGKRTSRRPRPMASSFSYPWGAAVNQSVNTDPQLQAAASPQGLRSGYLQR
jgi:hypothetical protein